MPRHAAWHCITQQAALCCFISSVAAVFCYLGVNRALDSIRFTVNWRACIDEATAKSTTTPEDVQHWWIGTETGSTSGRRTTRSSARHGDPQHRCTAQSPQLDVITGGPVNVCRTARDSARYSFWDDTILHGIMHRARLWHWTLHCTVPVVPHWGTAHKLYLHSIDWYELRFIGTVHCCNCCNCLTALQNTHDR